MEAASTEKSKKTNFMLFIIDVVTCKAKSRRGLGFRDLTSFNQVLVAKQGWRLLRFPDSLMARVMQAIYYKSSTFLNAKAGSIPSFIVEKHLMGKTSNQERGEMENRRWEERFCIQRQLDLKTSYFQANTASKFTS